MHALPDVYCESIQSILIKMHYSIYVSKLTSPIYAIVILGIYYIFAFLPLYYLKHVSHWPVLLYLQRRSDFTASYKSNLRSNSN